MARCTPCVEKKLRRMIKQRDTEIRQLEAGVARLLDENNQLHKSNIELNRLLKSLEAETKWGSSTGGRQ